MKGWMFVNITGCSLSGSYKWVWSSDNLFISMCTFQPAFNGLDQ